METPRLVSRMFSCLAMLTSIGVCPIDLAAEAHRRRADRLVVLLDGRADDDVLALRRLGDRLEHLGVLLDVARAVDDQRHADRVRDRLDRRDRVRDAAVGAVRVRARELQADQVRAERALALLRPRDRVGPDVAEHALELVRPVGGRRVVHLHRDLRRVRAACPRTSGTPARSRRPRLTVFFEPSVSSRILPLEVSTGAWNAIAASPPYASAGSPARRLAELTVLNISIAIVIGPTPPGTGVICEAFCATPS